MSLSETVALVEDLLREGMQWISPQQRDRAIALAVVRYSQDRPREVVCDVVSGGGQALPLPAEWVPDSSTLRNIETPVGHIPPSHVPVSMASIYRSPSGEEIRLTRSLQAGTAVRLTIGVPHVLDETDDSIPMHHREALACYAAGLLAEQLATAHADARDATIGADRVDLAHPAREWAMRARSYRNRYYSVMGIQIGRDGMEEPRQEAAGAVVDLDWPSSPGAHRLYRRR
jgi:hypothetical protein